MRWKRYPYRRELKARARKLRKNITYAEVLLWQEIRKNKLGYKFNRQISILNYIVDFLCRELELVIEVDGSGHAHFDAKKYDLKRQQELEALGLTVIGFTNVQVLHHRREVLLQLDQLIEQLKKN
ncbi:MAG: endonuclease domain-containing protein [Bacteroidota bacterium]